MCQWLCSPAIRIFRNVRSKWIDGRGVSGAVLCNEMGTFLSHVQINFDIPDAILSFNTICTGSPVLNYDVTKNAQTSMHKK